VLGLAVEQEWFAGGVVRLAGVDEAGRGPLAGPVVAAAVLVTPGTPCLEGVTDSKLLSRRRREHLAAAIVSSLPYAVGAASAREIDRLNIRRATALAMRRAVLRLPIAPDAILLDGLPMAELGMPHDALVGGDRRCYAIACASIVAKTVRDHLMRLLAPRYPAFGWERNAGYGTPYHLAALIRCGPTPHHRRTFAPLTSAPGHRRTGAPESP
jgi:ribonuclease HII